MAENEEPQEEFHETGEDKIHDVELVGDLYENWFLEYASYVILERAIPAVDDGLKPVQRRILHAMKEMDDGRFHKVANIIGQTMQYHPHGDAAIGDALVHLGQKRLLIDTQGNWGDIKTGDPAAAARYIEARLSKFALDVVFNADTTEWQLSYDGRKNEPIAFPVKFPLLLAQGVEGIAVGLATKILPHNFCELIKASIDILKGKKPKVFPDFLTGGAMDVADYNDGLKGGKIRVRAKVESLDKKTLVIKEIPFSTTTTSLIDSIIKANDKGKIKIKKVIDNTAMDVEILIDLPAGVSPDVTIDALYAFTDCEVSISPNACVIVEGKPKFIGVREILKISTDQTLELLKRELEIRRAMLSEKWHFASLEKIFIENRVYRDIEECETWEAVMEAIDKGIHQYISTPSRKNKGKGVLALIRDVTQDDMLKLTEIKIKRISKFDSFKADELIAKLEEQIAETDHHLANLVEFAIAYFSNLLEKYGKGRERKTGITKFDTIDSRGVAMANQKLYVDRVGGFVGLGLKKDEFVCECSDIDDIIAFRRDGKFMVSRVSDKTFVGKDILYVDVWKKGDDRKVYHLIYVDGGSGKSYVKRFNVSSITRDKEYDLTKGNKGSKVHYFTANPNGESEVVTVHLSSSARAKIKVFDYYFSELAIKGRGAGGNTLTRYPIRKVVQKEVGESTIGGRDIWFDETVGRLNTEERGEHLGQFDTSDKILVLYKDGKYEMTTHDLTNRYNMSDISAITKFDPERIINVVYYEGEKKNWFVKRFQVETSSVGEKFSFIGEDPKSKIGIVSIADRVLLTVNMVKGKQKEKEVAELELTELIDVKGWKSLGNRLSQHTIRSIKLKEEEFAEVEPQPELQEFESPKSVSDSNKTEEPPGTNDKEAKQQTEAPESEGVSVGSQIEWEIEPTPDAESGDETDKPDSEDPSQEKNDGSQGSLF